jgi:hypothetical protein
MGYSLSPKQRNDQRGANRDFTIPWLKIRFDINDPWMNDSPHFHVEQLGPDGKWVDAGSQHRYPINTGGGSGNP